MDFEVVKGRRGVENLKYKCTNEEVGCSYVFPYMVPANGEMVGIRPDGSEAARR